MSDHDRGAYTPPSDRLSFDPREPVRSGGPAPVMLIVSGLVLLVIVGGVFLLYRGGIRHKGDAPVAVGEPIAQMKSPAPPDANDIPAGLVISKVDASNMTAANATFAPPPEEPLPRPLPVQAPSVVTSTPLPPPAAGAPPRLASPPAAPRPVATTPTKPSKPVTIASLTDDAMAQKPVVKPPPAPPVAPAAVATPAAASAAAGGWVQIGAFSSSALADKGWSDIAALAPAGMSGKGRKVEPVSKDGKTFYRAYVTGFASRDAAQAFCDKLKAAAKACFVK
jgi:cell division protein FtsN